jgi:predicted RNA-binding protein with RPS1 domain
MEEQKQNRIPQQGEIIEVEVYKVITSAAFVKLPGKKEGILHISQISEDYVENIGDYIKVGDKIRPRVLSVKGKRIELTLLKEKPLTISLYPQGKTFRGATLAEKLSTLFPEANTRI